MTLACGLCFTYTSFVPYLQWLTYSMCFTKERNNCYMYHPHALKQHPIASFHVLSTFSKIKNYQVFSNSLIIHAALTQPEHLILVRWMSLETQWKPSWKHGRAWKLCFKLFETRMQIFLICILIKQQKHVAINNYFITHFTKQTVNPNYLLLTLNVTVQVY